MHSDRAWLNVRSDESKELLSVTNKSAKWDEEARSWYVDLKTATEHGSSLQKWFRPQVSQVGNEPVLPMTIYGLEYKCYGCGRVSLAVVWWAVPGDDISSTARKPLELAAAALWSPQAQQVSRRSEWAHFDQRFSKTQDEAYFSNGCRFDYKIFGEVRLSQAYEAALGSTIVLAVVPVPNRLVNEVFDWYDEN